MPNSGSPRSSDAKDAGKLTFGQWLRSRFITGVVVAAPIGVTLFLIWSFVSFVDARVKPLIPARWNPETYIDFAVPGFGLLIAIVAIIVVGPRDLPGI